MLIFSIVPLHLLKDNDGIAANRKNSLDVLEHSVMELEALYTALILNQYYEGVGTGANKQAVYSALQTARAKEIEERKTKKSIAENNSALRVGYLKYMNEISDIRINDLKELKCALNEGKTLDRYISLVDNSNVHSVNHELGRSVEFKNAVNEAEKFWTEVSNLQAEATKPKEEVTHSDETENLNIEMKNSLPVTEQVQSKTIPKVLSEKELEQLALAKRRVAELQTLLSTMSNNKSLGELKAEGNSLKGLLEQELATQKRQLELFSGNKTTNSSDRTSEIRLAILTNQSEQNIARLVSDVKESVSSDLKTQISSLSM